MSNWTPPNFDPRAPGPQVPFAPQPEVPAVSPAPLPDSPKSDFSDLDPKMLQRLADMYGISYDEAATMVRMKRAEMLAGKSMPQGRSHGGVFVASNPLEMLGAAGQQMMGMKGMGGAADELGLLGKRRAQDAYAQYQLYGAPDFSF